MHHIVFICLSVDEHVGCSHFWLLGIKFMNVGIHSILLSLFFSFFGYMTRSEIAGSHRNFMFNCLRNHSFSFFKMQLFIPFL